MENNEIYITIKLNRETHKIIKGIAETYHMTQSELINKICDDYIEDFKNLAIEIATKKLEEIGIK